MNAIGEARNKLRTFLKENKRFTMPLILMGGFVADWFTLNRIDQVFDNIIFIVHLVLSGLAVAFLHATDHEYLQDHPRREKFRTWAWGIMLFSFGALYSGFFIFYLRSASFVTSWAVIIGLLAIMLSTEWKRDFYTHRTVQIGVYYFALLCYSIFLVPILTKQIGAGIFILSTILSLAVGGLFVYLLWFLDEEGINIRRSGILSVMIGTAVLMNFLYFMNIIPPIPLSMQYKSPYVQMSKQETSAGLTYRAGYEKTPWYNILHESSRVIPWEPGRNVYVFAAIFAPTDIRTQIRHCWEYFDTDTRTWESANCIPIAIVGGRGGGYRGFSQKGNLWEGKWRVRFLTQRNQTLGILKFRIIEGTPDADKIEFHLL
jgi:hypothetical protein